MSIFISSGEASGDHYAAMLTKTLRGLGFASDIWGMGGLESRDAGLRALWHGERLQLIGFMEVITAVPSILALIKEVSERILELAPSVVVVIDSPDYHMRLLSRLRKRGYRGRIFYISPPAVWAWRSGRANDLRLHVDECLPLFKFEHDYLVSRGCKSYWIGSPLLEEFRPESLKPSPCSDIYGDKNYIAFLPGSRSSEIKNLLPVMKEVAHELSKRGWHPVFSVAPGLNPKVRKPFLEHLTSLKIDYYEGHGRDLMASALCAVGASGTTTVESLLLGCYMVVAYKVNPISAALAKMIIKTPYFAMTNILAGEEIFPEFIQNDVTAHNILTAALNWLESDESFKAEIAEKIRKTRNALGVQGVYQFWAKRMIEVVSYA